MKKVYVHRWTGEVAIQKSKKEFLIDSTFHIDSINIYRNNDWIAVPIKRIIKEMMK